MKLPNVLKTHPAMALSGDTTTIATHNGDVTADNTYISKGDIAVMNGVIHVAVTFPKDK